MPRKQKPKSTLNQNQASAGQTGSSPSSSSARKKAKIDPEILRIRAKLRAEVEAYQKQKNSGKHLKNIIDNMLPRLIPDDVERLKAILASTEDFTAAEPDPVEQPTMIEPEAREEETEGWPE